MMTFFFFNSAALLRVHPWTSRVNRAEWTFSRAGSCLGPPTPPCRRDQGKPPPPGGLPRASPCQPPRPQEGGRRLHSPGSNLTTKRQRSKAARRLFLKGREKKCLTAESQSWRSNVSSDRNLWEEEPGRGDGA